MVVCGTNFGRFYAEAVLAHPGYTLAAILSRGSAASRAYARRPASLTTPRSTSYRTTSTRRASWSAHRYREEREPHWPRP